MKILTIILIIIISGIWGYFQFKIFPTEQFGYLNIFTSFIGGYIIGYIGAKLFLNN